VIAGIRSKHVAMLAVVCVAYAAYIAAFANLVPIRLDSVLNLVVAPAIFGVAFAVAAQGGGRVLPAFIGIPAFAIFYLLSGPGDPAKPQLHLLASLITAGVSVCACIASALLLRRRARSRERTRPSTS